MNSVTLIGLLFLFTGTIVFSQDGRLIPIEFPISRYQNSWSNSPFTREVKKAEAPIIAASSFGKSLILEGMVNDDSVGTIAYIRDISSEALHSVTSEKSESHPYIIVKANQVSDPRQTSVTISNGSETQEIKYPNNSLIQPLKTIEQKPTVRKIPKGSKPASKMPVPSKTETSDSGTDAAAKPPKNGTPKFPKPSPPSSGTTPKKRPQRVFLPPR